MASSPVHRDGARPPASKPRAAAPRAVSCVATVVTSTRVKPDRHDRVAAALLCLIKDTFDRQAIGLPRKALIPPVAEERARAAGQGS